MIIYIYNLFIRSVKISALKQAIKFFQINV